MSKDIKVINKEAAAIMYSEYETAIEKFEEVIALSTTQKVDDYDLLYAHYGVIYSAAGYINKYYGKLNDPKVQEYIHRGFALGERIFDELLPPDFIIAHFTPTGKFQEEVIRYTSNFLVWYAFSINDKDATLKYLPYVERSFNHVYENDQYYVYDSYVRALLLLDRKEEAYKIVKRVTNTFPNFEDFKDFNTNTDYQQWLATQQQPLDNIIDSLTPKQYIADGRNAFFEEMKQQYCKKEPIVTAISYTEVCEMFPNNYDDIIENLGYMCEEDVDLPQIILVEGDIYLEEDILLSTYGHEGTIPAAIAAYMSGDTDFYAFGYIFRGNVVVNGSVIFAGSYVSLVVEGSMIVNRLRWQDTYTHIKSLVVRELFHYTQYETLLTINNITAPVILGDVLESLSNGMLTMENKMHTLCIRKEKGAKESESFNPSVFDKLLVREID